MRDGTLVGLAVVVLSLLAWLAIHMPEVRAREAIFVDGQSDAEDLDDSRFAASTLDRTHDARAAGAVSERAAAVAPDPALPSGGSVDVTVRRGGEAVATAVVDVAPASGERDWMFDSPRPPTQTTDVEGRAHFGALADGAYAVRVRLREGGETAWLSHVDVDEEARTSTLELALGTARVRGHVYGSDGMPARGAAVFALTFDRGWWLQRAWTDALGAYELVDLPASGYLPIVATEGPRFESEPIGSVELVIADGEGIEVDIGHAAGLAHWRGVVRLTTGTPIVGPGELELLADGGAPTRVRFGAGGRIDVEIAPGRYTVQKVGSQSARSAPFSLVVPRSEHDVVLHGSSIGGVVRYAGHDFGDAREAVRDAILELVREGDDASSYRPCAREGDRFVFCGLARGNYRLQATSWRVVGAPQDGLPVSIASDGSDVTLDIVITDR